MTTKNIIWIIGSLHATHKTNPNYSYEHLYTYIDTYKPDYIGIEVRQQDMKENPDKRMVFITGIFHREGLMEALQQEGIKERLLKQEEEETILLG